MKPLMMTAICPNKASSRGRVTSRKLVSVTQIILVRLPNNTEAYMGMLKKKVRAAIRKRRPAANNRRFTKHRKKTREPQYQ